MPYSAPSSKEVKFEKDYTCLDLNSCTRPAEIRALIEDADNYVELDKIEIGLCNSLRILRILSKTKYNTATDFLYNKSIYDCSIYDSIKHKREELHVVQTETRRANNYRFVQSETGNKFRDSIIDNLVITGNIKPYKSGKSSKSTS